MNDDGPTTREEWLENNASVMRAEQATEDEIFYNSIETRLANHMNWVDEGEEKDADERLGNAYINSLAQFEARGDYTTWCPLSVEHLVEHEGVTSREAGVIAQMTALEYGTINPREVLEDFLKWLQGADDAMFHNKKAIAATIQEFFHYSKQDWRKKS